MKPIPITIPRARRWLPARPKNANKGTFGRVLIVAGSRGMAGAAFLAALGAVRSGAGLVRLAIVKSQQAAAVKRLPFEVTTEALPEDRHGRLGAGAKGALRRIVDQYRPTVLVVGPGLGVSTGVRSLVHDLLSKTSLPVVLDADGLNVMTPKMFHRAGPLIVTPHPGEFSRLTGRTIRDIQRRRAELAFEFARAHKCVCVLKGAGTIVTDGRAVFQNTTGNPGMAKGGTGDVLAGLIGGLWAQFISGSDAAVCSLSAAAVGVFLHGMAGDFAAQRFSSRAMLASELANFIGKVFRKIKSV